MSETLPPYSYSLAPTPGQEPLQSWLTELGVRPQSWDQVVAEISLRLGPAGLENFRRHHQNYTGYPTPDTLTRFYNFVYAHGLGDLLVNFRAHRIAAILPHLNTQVTPGLRILEQGAGTGTLLQWIKTHKAPQELLAIDFAHEAQAYFDPLEIPFQVWAKNEKPTNSPLSSTYDLVICADSLGELHADEEGELRKAVIVWSQLNAKGKSKALAAQNELIIDLFEERYGYTEKIIACAGLWVTTGSLLFFEPFTQPALQFALETRLNRQGFRISRLNSPGETVALRIWAE